MRFSESEIVEDMLEHIRQAGGEFREWRVGTAPDKGTGGLGLGAGERNPQHAEADFGDGLLCREAYTTFAAEEVAERLAGFGLKREHATTSNPAAVVHSGKTVFVYRPVDAKNAEGSPQKVEAGRGQRGSLGASCRSFSSPAARG